MEANGFAAQLLMPANIVKEELEKYIADYRRETHQTPSNDDKVVALSAVFNVSRAAMEYRLSKLGELK